MFPFLLRFTQMRVYLPFVLRMLPFHLSLTQMRVSLSLVFHSKFMPPPCRARGETLLLCFTQVYVEFPCALRALPFAHACLSLSRVLGAPVSTHVARARAHTCVLARCDSHSVCRRDSKCPLEYTQTPAHLHMYPTKTSRP